MLIPTTTFTMDTVVTMATTMGTTMGTTMVITTATTAMEATTTTTSTSTATETKAMRTLARRRSLQTWPSRHQPRRPRQPGPCRLPTRRSC